jgi:hypothetical protein
MNNIRFYGGEKIMRETKKRFYLYFFIICVFLLFSMALEGCKSDDGDNGEEESGPFIAPPPSASGDTYTARDGYSLVWSDEFNSTEINLSNWSYETEEG